MDPTPKVAESSVAVTYRISCADRDALLRTLFDALGRVGIIDEGVVSLIDLTPSEAAKVQRAFAGRDLQCVIETATSRPSTLDALRDAAHDACIGYSPDLARRVAYAWGRLSEACRDRRFYTRDELTAIAQGLHLGVLGDTSEGNEP